MGFRGFLIIGAVLAVVGAAIWLYQHGKHVDSLEGKNTTQGIVIEKAKANADIQANRPDFDALVERVLNFGAY